MNTANEELLNIIDWMKANKLSVNVSKTQYMIFASPRKRAGLARRELSIAGSNLECVRVAKFLGVMLDENLTWHEQIGYISKKVARSVGVLCQMRFVLQTTQLKMLYNALVLPYLNYCNLIWASTYQSIRYDALCKIATVEKCTL